VLFSYATVLVHLRRPRPARGPRPPITILKPLRGADDALDENLRSFARQEYPRFQIVFGAEESNDVALAAARRIRREFPAVDIAIVAGAPAFGRNPKVTNLASMCTAARHGLWLVSDSNVRVGPGYLAAMADALAEERADLVSSVFVGVGEQALGAAFENLQINTFVAAGICGSQYVARVPVVVGKSMLFRARAFEALGGWAAFRDVLAEDYRIGAAFVAAGRKVAISTELIETVNRRWSLLRFLNRHVRWALLRRWGTPAVFLGEPLMNPVLWSAALAAAGALPAAAAVAGAKVLADLWLGRRLGRRRYSPAAPLLILAKDLLVAGIWVAAAFRRTVSWRGHRLRIGAGTCLLPPSPLPARPLETVARGV